MAIELWNKAFSEIETSEKQNLIVCTAYGIGCRLAKPTVFK